jgi:hypothetical protein
MTAALSLPAGFQIKAVLLQITEHHCAKMTAALSLPAGFQIKAVLLQLTDHHCAKFDSSTFLCLQAFRSNHRHCKA